MKRAELGVTAEDRLAHFAGQLAASNRGRIGAILVRAGAVASRGRELAKVAGDDGRIRASLVRTRAGAPGFSVMRSLSTSAMTFSGNPASSLMRLRQTLDMGIAEAHRTGIGDQGGDDGG